MCRILLSWWADRIQYAVRPVRPRCRGRGGRLACPDDTPTEPIGSIPRPQALSTASSAAAGEYPAGELDALFDDAVRDTIRRFEATGSPVVTDGEQRKPSFATYPLSGLTNLAARGVTSRSRTATPASCRG